MDIRYKIKKAVFALMPSLVGYPYVITDINYRNYTEDIPLRYRMSIHGTDQVDSLKVEIQEFLEKSNGFFLTRWFRGPKVGDWPGASAQQDRRLIWFLEKGDALQFKLLFGCNDRSINV